MSQNTYKEAVIKLAKQIKKEHFIKLALWISGVSLTLMWLAMVLATSISTGELKIYGEAISPNNQDHFYTLVENGFTPFLENQKVVMRKLQYVKDFNPMCLTYDSNLIGWYICILLAPIGYMGIIYIIAYMKNMITPNAIKTTLRKALQFNYLKQQDVDYVVNEIDYNIGLKERPKENEEQNINSV